MLKKKFQKLKKKQFENKKMVLNIFLAGHMLLFS